MSFLQGALQIPEEYKMVFVVNMELEMGRGKQCAQVAHAAVALSYEMLTSSSGDNLGFALWLSAGQKKIVLRGENLEQMTKLQTLAAATGLQSHIVADAGHTQVAPGSKTVLAIFGKSREVDSITGDLRLL